MSLLTRIRLNTSPTITRIVKRKREVTIRAEVLNGLHARKTVRAMSRIGIKKVEV